MADKVAIALQWEPKPRTDHYTIHGWPVGEMLGPIDTWETREPRITIDLPLGTLYAVTIFSGQGQTVSIDAEEIKLYATRW